MSDILVTSPCQPFTLPTQFKAVFNGYIYCGTVDAVDPSVSQVQVYLVNESGDKVPVAQPLRTNAGGFLVYNGQPAKFVTDSNHSLLVRDSLGTQLWYEPNIAIIDPAALAELLAGSGGASMIGSSSGGSVQDELNNLERHIASSPAYVDAYKLPGMTDTQAIDAAMAASKYVVFSDRKYAYTKPLISVGHTLEGAVGETFSTTGTIIEFDIAATPATPFAYRNITNKGVARNIRFIQKSWPVGVELNGCRIDRKTTLIDCDFSYFNGYGIVLESVDSVPRGCYASSLINVTCDYNAKHGIVYGGSANAVTNINPTCRWNGAPAYGVQPSVAGGWDGINSSGIDGPFPGNGLTGEPQGNVIIGGNISYNSRYGYNLYRWWQGSIMGGYAEVNKVGDANFVNMFGSSISNLMLMQAPNLAIPDVDPAAPSRSLLTYPNSIWINGRDFGCGQPSPVQPALWARIAAALRFFGSNGSTWINGTSSGGIEVSRQNTNTNLKWNFGSVPTYSASISLGDGAVAPATGVPVISRSGNTEAATLLSMVGTSHYTEFFVANSGGANAAATALRIAKNSGTSRSINAAGTVNASGADYAEYMHKDDSCGEIPKGAICGVTDDGLLTDQFDMAISFVVKSTDPAYVGGDTWGAIEEPIRYQEYEAWVAKCEAVYSDKPTLREEETEQEYATRLNEWSALWEALMGSEPEKRDSDEWMAWVADLETRRHRVDRIAFCGQVPCNVVGATPGDCIVPVRNDDGSIGGVAIKDPSFEQYRRAVGTVWKMMDDGRAWIAVKVS